MLLRLLELFDLRADPSEQHNLIHGLLAAGGGGSGVGHSPSGAESGSAGAGNGSSADAADGSPGGIASSDGGTDGGIDGGINAVVAEHLSALRFLWGLVAARHAQPPRGPLLAWLFDVEHATERRKSTTGVADPEGRPLGGGIGVELRRGNAPSHVLPPSPLPLKAAWAPHLVPSQAAAKLLVDRRGWWYKQVLLAAPNGFPLTPPPAVALSGQQQHDDAGANSAGRYAAAFAACGASHADDRWKADATGVPGAAAPLGAAQLGAAATGAVPRGGSSSKGRTPPAVLAPCRHEDAATSPREVALGSARGSALGGDKADLGDRGAGSVGPAGWCAVFAA